ncbi:MAG: hypothetical protein RKR03_20535 [Candidatus Competibacter sp.]|nr:hypothetical protein [Candidatus Competibacter sp.]MDS4058945.1 hypothetical protein [Candidatus Contendobacter sp.]
MNAKQLMVGLGFSMIAAASVPAMANDAKTLPGAACQPKSNSPTAFEISSSGQLINTSTTDLTVICPIVRDVMAANSSNGINKAQVHVIDRNVDRPFTCTLRSYATSTGSYGSSTQNTGNSFASANVQILGHGNLASSADGYYLFECTIPGTYNGTRSSIVTYNWNETD